MRKPFSILLTVFVLTMVFVGLSAAFFPRVHGGLIGYLAVAWWEHVDHENAPLHCGGHQQMTIRGKRLRTDLRGAFPTSLLNVGGDCEMHIVDCDLEAPTVLSAGGDANVLISGGRMYGTRETILAGGHALIEVRDARIEGRIQRGGEARILGLR